MNPFTALIAAEHLADIRREAAASRLAREAEEANSHPGTPRGRDPRRALAQLAVRVSRAAGGAAQQLDPALEDCFGTPRTARATGR